MEGNTVNRVAVWTLGTISGFILFFGIFSVGTFGYSASSSCSSYGDNPPPVRQRCNKLSSTTRWQASSLLAWADARAAGHLHRPTRVDWRPILAQRRGRVVANCHSHRLHHRERTGDRRPRRCPSSYSPALGRLKPVSARPATAHPASMAAKRNWSRCSALASGHFWHPCS